MYKLILQSSRQSEPEPDREGGAAGADGCSLHGGLEARGSVRASHRETYPISLDVHRCREEHGLQKRIHGAIFLSRRMRGVTVATGDRLHS